MEQQQYRFEHDLADIFRSVWGYTAFPYFFRTQNAVEKALFGRNKGESEEYNFNYFDRGEDANSCLGVPFYAPNNNGKKMFLPIWLIKPDGGKILLQNTVSSLTNKKTIVETPLVNRQGTVKEEVSVCDWEMNVKGIAVGATPDQYPETEVLELINLYKMGVSLGIQNVRTAMAFYGEGGNHKLGIGDETVVIKDLRLPEIQGRKHCQAFEMNLVSDLAFDLYIE
jgi:hypothetical protein